MKQEFNVGDRVFVSTMVNGTKRGIIVEKEPGPNGRLRIADAPNGISSGFWYSADQLKKATFLQYLFWPTGFGKTPWSLFILIQSMIALGVIVSASEGMAWMGCIAFAVIDGVLVLGTWMNYTRRWA